MKPDPKRLLDVAAAHVMMKLGPALPSGYEQSGTMVLGVMLMALNEEMERGAARRVEENREMRRIFAEAAPVVTDAALGERLAAAANADDTSFAISDLERGNAELRGLLIELHALIEGLDGTEARRIDDAIWRELVTSTERRRLLMAPF
jgi:hypothetical protein